MVDAQLLVMEEEFTAFILVSLVDLMLIYGNFLATQKAKTSPQRQKSHRFSSNF